MSSLLIKFITNEYTHAFLWCFTEQDSRSLVDEMNVTASEETASVAQNIPLRKLWNISHW